MNSLASQLLPLLISLSPLESEEKMVELVLEAVNSALDGLTLRFVAGGRGLDLVVDGEVLGAFELDGPRSGLAEETESLLRLTISVLGGFMGDRRRARKLSAEKVRTEAKYRLLSERVPVGLFEMDAVGDCIYMNEHWSEISGVPAEQAMGRAWERAIHPDDRAAVLERWNQCVAAGEGFDERFRCSRPDGSVRYVSVIVTPERCEAGTLRGFAGAVMDITPAHEVEAALERNEERLRLTLDAVEEAVLEYDRETGVAYFSPRFYRILGYEPNAFPATKERFWNLVHPDDLQNCMEVLHRNYSGTNPFTVDGRMRFRNGGWRWIRVRGRVLTHSATGEAVRLLGTFLDITEQRETEEEFRLILRMCFDGFLVVARDLRVLDANDAYCRLTGYSREELLTLSVGALEAYESPETAGAHAAAIRSGGWHRFESGHRRKDGTVVALELNISWSPSGGGRYLSFVRDLTERNLMLQQLRDSELKYRELVDNQAGVVFTASVDGVVQYASPQTELVLGGAPSSWVGRPLADMVEPRYAEELERQWARALAGGAVAPVEVEFRFGAGGERRWVAVSLSAQRDGDGACQSVLGTIWDLTERKLIEESLQRSEEQFRSVWESSVDGMRLADGEGTILRVNEAFCRMFGRTREEIEGRPLKECYGSDYQRGIHESFRSKYPDRIARIFEAHVDLWNGTPKWLEVSNSLIPHRGGPIVLSIFRDITERKATEAQLSVLVRAIEQSPASVLVTDTQGRIEYVNPKFCAITGYTAEEVRGQNPRILKSGRNPDSIYRDLWSTIGAGREWHGEMLNRRRDGTLFWEQASISPVKNVSGDVTHYVAVKEDITQRKVVQEAFEESERRFREMLEHVELLAVLLDSQGRVTFCNDYLCRVTGWTREELMGRDWFEMMIPDSIRDSVRAGHRPHLENEILAADGRRLLIAWDNTLLRGPSGEIAGTASLGRDITSQRLLEEQYRQAQKLESLGRLAGGVAHDFNNLLTVINGYSEMLMVQFDPLDPMYAKTKEILRAGHRAAELTKHLLAFSRKQMIERKVVQLNDLLTEVERMLQRLIGEDIQLELQTHADLATVEVDPGQIHQVLMNLAVNARDAMPKGGTLWIETAPLEVSADASTDWDLPPGSYAQLTVGDSGMGMEPETQRHAFEPFFTTKGLEQGTGLGLATVYGIVKQNGGGIQFESQVGAGTTFRIALPVSGKPLPTARGVAKQPERGHESVLLVEDQVEVRRLAAAILKKFGYDVHEAADGLEGLELGSERRFDLLLSDLVMPNLGGYELAQQLVLMQPAIRILFMSGYADQDEREWPDNIAAGFIAKPFSPQALAARVREILDA